jgi:hypothetical protein
MEKRWGTGAIVTFFNIGFLSRINLKRLGAGGGGARRQAVSVAPVRAINK